ncbi:MAG: bifunctional DNA-formamidopyrimidine glycosylase/DNA-(apurinic or apyrimidinic site) lyase [Acidimicrobiales bacterium]
MPELPEVETIRRQIEPAVVGRRVVDAGSHPSEKFRPARALVGAAFTGARRRGKFLLFPTDDHRELVVHLGMTGSLAVRSGADGGRNTPGPADPHLRAWWILGDPAGGAPPARPERLDFRDIRRFGRIRVVPLGDHGSIPGLVTMGPEPFDPGLDAARFHRLLRRSRRRIKTQLLSQRPIAGVGNIYADEALWLARINPNATRLSEHRAGVLLDALRTVLARGLDNGGTTLRDYRDAKGNQGANQHGLAAYGRKGLPCVRCATEMRSATIDTRTTTWCPHCQRH